MCAYGIYFRASFFNHNCMPNACSFKHFDEPGRENNTNLIFRAMYEILEDSEISTSYFLLGMSYKERLMILQENYEFECDCHGCAIEEQCMKTSEKDEEEKFVGVQKKRDTRDARGAQRERDTRDSGGDMQKEREIRNARGGATDTQRKRDTRDTGGEGAGVQRERDTKDTGGGAGSQKERETRDAGGEGSGAQRENNSTNTGGGAGSKRGRVTTTYYRAHGAGVQK
jgi:SET domain